MRTGASTHPAATPEAAPVAAPDEGEQMSDDQQPPPPDQRPRSAYYRRTTPPGPIDGVSVEQQRKRRRWLLFGIGGALGICVICGLLVTFVAMPRIRDGVQDNIKSAISTEVARQIPAVPGGSAAPGTYTITAASLEETLRSSGNDRTETENAIVRINSRQIEIGLDAQGQDAMYTGVPVAVDGELRMEQMQSTSRVLEFILSPSDLGEAIADPLNAYLAANDLRLESIELQEGQLQLTTVAR